MASPRLDGEKKQLLVDEFSLDYGSGNHGLYHMDKQTDLTRSNSMPSLILAQSSPPITEPQGRASRATSDWVGPVSRKILPEVPSNRETESNVEFVLLEEEEESEKPQESTDTGGTSEATSNGAKAKEAAAAEAAGKIIRRKSSLPLRPTKFSPLLRPQASPRPPSSPRPALHSDFNSPSVVAGGLAGGDSIVRTPMFWSEDELAAFLVCLGLGRNTARNVKRRAIKGVDQLVQMSDAELRDDFGLATQVERLVVRKALKRFLELDRWENAVQGLRPCDTADDPVLRAFMIPPSEINVGSEISEGGFAHVYRAMLKPSVQRGKFEKDTEHLVAVKAMKGDRNMRLNELAKEARIMASLSHDNVSLFVGICAARPGGAQYIVSELMDCSLFDLVHQPHKLQWFGELTMVLALRLAMGICAGLVYLHARSLVHADLKSSNILINYSSGSSLVPKICDFGHVAVRTHPLPHRRCGTPHWAAPEALRHEAVSAAADVFSSGVILWEMLTQHLPHSGLTFAQVIGAVGWGGWIPDMGLLSEAPPSLRESLKHCLSFEPAQRQSAREFRSQLRGMFRRARTTALGMLVDFFGRG